MIKKNKIFLILFFYSFYTFSQLQVKNYFAFAGKKDIGVNVITQDKYGFLWLGTNQGVYKFDGKTALVIGKENSILKKEITALFIDSNQTVWIGTKAGKVYFYKNTKIDSINFKLKPNEEKITSICEINSAICISTYGSGIYVYANNQLKNYNAETGLSDNVVYKLETDAKNTIWCATDGGITQIKNITTLPIFKLISNKIGLPDNIVRDISYQNEKLIISMQDSGVCAYNTATSKLEKTLFFSNWSLGTVLNATSKVPNKTIIATEKNGFLQINSGIISIYNYEQYLQTSSINQLFIDNAKQIWVASKKGLSHFYDRRYDFINNTKNLSDDKILALATDNNNTIWIGTANGISKIIADNDGKIIVTKIQQATKYILSCANKSPNGDIWFGSYGNGITIINSETKKISVYNSKNTPQLNDNISNIYFFDNTTVYISTLGGGLIKAKINLEGNQPNLVVEKNYTETEGLGSNYIYAAIADNNGKLYVASDGGGLELLQNEKFISLTKKFKLNVNTIISLCKDRYNSIWASSNANGILKYDGKTIKTFNQTNGLRDEQPQQIVTYQNTLFSISSKGIDKINCLTDSITFYDFNDSELEPNLNAIFLNNNKIYSGTNNGILIYRTNIEELDTIRPIAFITTLQINYKPFAIDSVFKFKYNQNNLAFGFDATWLKNPNNLLYRYKLNGLENDWLYSSEGKVINYNNLGVGSYTFMVQAKNEEDIWSDTATFSFSILAPIWQKWWFWLIIVFLTASIIYTFLKYRLKSLQKENLILEEKVTLRTKEIEKQSEVIANANKELEQLSIVASRTDNVVLILKPNGDIEFVNESFQKLNRITLKEILEQKLNIFTSSNNPKIREIVDEAILTKRSIKYESFNDKNPDNMVWEASTLTPIFDENNQIKKIIIIDSDISESKLQQKIIEQKNKDITDSISYARKIQHAILPENTLIKKHIPNSFILYMTKDIVSGDFYWFTQIEDCSIIAAIDCTGHGVPGAFMSLIGYNILNKIVNEQKIVNPKDILFELNNGVLETLYKNESESKDGMDVAICKINHSQNTLEYAGAMRPLWIINNMALKEIKADKIPIGTKQQDRTEKITYTTHTFNLNKGDSFYIFTDGYADQFGGSKEKKYSTAKLKELIIKNSNLDFETQEKNLKAEHLIWKGAHEQVDDILVIGFRV